MRAPDRDTATRRPFRICRSCGARWATLLAFLEDATVRVVGLQVAGHVPDANILIFEHVCGSTVSVRASRLRFLLADPQDGAGRPTLFGSELCRGFCRSLDDFSTCDRSCANARDRRVLQIVLRIKDEGRVPLPH